MFALGRWYLWFRRIGWFFAHRWTRYVLAWLLAIAAAGQITYESWTVWDRPNRLDGNDGHTSIDFGSQWLMGRMLVLGEGRNLYERDHLRAVLQESYPRHLQGTDKKRRPDDADELFGYLMGKDEPNAAGRKVGGALYPPINAFVHYPFALFDPQTGYRIHQISQIAFVFLCGLAVGLLSGGRIWVPVALVLILYYPDFIANQILGQNAHFTLAIVLWGWVLISRNHEIGGGLVWGLLAYKPVWAMSFFFVLLLTRRWRGGLAMLGCGALLAGLTLPVVGLHSWLEWRHIAGEVAWGNRVHQNWIELSRTLFSIPRRYLVDFGETNLHARDTLPINIVSWALYVLVIELSVRLIVLRGKDARTVQGAGAAFILSTAWLCCFQFMYYDALISFAAVIVLFLNPRDWLRPDYLARILPRWQQVRLRPWSALATVPHQQQVQYATGKTSLLSLPTSAIYGWVKNPLVLLPIVMLYALQNYLIAWDFASDRDPYIIYCVLALWLWCGWLWTREAARAQAIAREPAAGEIRMEQDWKLSQNGPPLDRKGRPTADSRAAAAE